LVPDLYDDGGLSGGTMERPALKRLLADIESGRIDVVVVYKVDRLTRSLTDFARIVEIFDARDASFVSVTQAFNTTSSMGRLTLNVLLSFAQFEREVTGERIRDKIAASKKKGMWMGGLPSLGYDVGDRKLVVNEIEAQTVRHIYERYIELGSVRQLKMELDDEGIVSKIRTFAGGVSAGGKPFSRGALYWMLKNRLYLGEVVHKDLCYPGEHDAIINEALWDKVQMVLNQNRNPRNLNASAQSPSLLAGLLYDDTGERMTPSHAVRRGKRYRYYISCSLLKQTREEASRGRRVPVADIEGLVIQRIWGLLSNQGDLFQAIEPLVPDANDQQHLLGRAAQLSRAWFDLPPVDMRDHLQSIIQRIVIHDSKVDIHIDRHNLIDALEGKHGGNLPSADSPSTSVPLTLTVQARLRRTGMQQKIIIDGPSGKAEPDANLIKLITEAHHLNAQLIAGNGASLASIAAAAQIGGSWFTRLIRITHLAPDITKAILDGRHPPELTANKLLRDTRLPLDWDEQRKMLGFV
jgi:DNA invertase Pin-like site-specific DNA recombinase